MPTPDPDPDPSGHTSSPHVNLTALLRQQSQALTGERVSLRDILQLLGKRSFGFALLLFALPNSLPVIGIPGVSTITGLPLLFIALQMAFGFERVYLPGWLAERSLPRENFQNLIAKAEPWLLKFERITRSRLNFWVQPKLEPLLGLFCASLAFLLILPIPLGNLLPALGVLLIALGLIERDGVFVIAGLMVGVVSWIVLGGLIMVALHAVLNLFQNF